MFFAHNDMLQSEYRVQLFCGVICNILFAVAFQALQEQSNSAVNCHTLHTLGTQIALYSFASAALISLLLAFTNYAAKQEAFACFKASVIANGIFGIIYGVFWFCCIAHISIVYDNIQQECGKIRILIYFYIMFGYLLHLLVMASFCALYTLSLCSLTTGIWPFYIQFRMQALNEDSVLDINEAQFLIRMMNSSRTQILIQIS